MACAIPPQLYLNSLDSWDSITGIVSEEKGSWSLKIPRGCPSDSSLVGMVNNDSTDFQSSWLGFQDSFQLRGGHRAWGGGQLGPVHTVPNSSFLTTLGVHYCAGCHCWRYQNSNATVPLLREESLPSSWREFLAHRKLQPVAQDSNSVWCCCVQMCPFDSLVLLFKRSSSFSEVWPSVYFCLRWFVSTIKDWSEIVRTTFFCYWGWPQACL